MRWSSLLVATALLSLSVSARASTIASFTDGTATNGAAYVGQPFTVGGTGNYNGITFNFLSPTGGTPYAIGTGYLFSRLFPGEPGALNYASHTPDMGFVATASSGNGVYTFDPTLTLTGGNTYYFYEDALIPQNSIMGTAYIPTNLTAQFPLSFAPFGLYFLSPGSNDFQVQGSIAATPEPSGLVLLGTGVLGMVGLVRRRLA